MNSAWAEFWSPPVLSRFLSAHFRRNHRRAVAVVLLPLCWWTGGGGEASAQEALRAANANADATAAQHKAANTQGYYNLKMGDLSLRFATGLGATYTDNANLTPTKDPDEIFTPSLSTQLVWPVTDRNTLHLTMNVGYQYYVQNADLRQFYVTPGSEIAMNIYVGDFTFNVHERPSLYQYAYQNPAVTGSGNQSQLQNTVGVAGQWRLNKAVANFGYDHNNYWSLGGPTTSGQQDGSSEVVYASAGAYVQPELQLGVQTGAGWIQYVQNQGLPNAFQWNAGGYGTYLLSQYLSFRGSAGYTVYAPEPSATAGTLPSTSGVYADLALKHRINEFLTYQIAAGRAVTVSFYGAPYENYFANLGMDWHLLHEITLSTPFSYLHGTYLDSTQAPFDQFQAGLTLGRTLTEKLSGSLGYQYVRRYSSEDSGNYTVNTISLIFRYQF